MGYTVTCRGETLRLETGQNQFSPGGADRGTLAMLSCADFQPGMKVLDLGCGCGLVGLVAARLCGPEGVWLSDIDSESVRIARENARENGLSSVHVVLSDAYDAIDASGFDLILTNPPYQSDFSVAKRFIEKGFNRLRPGGKMLLVVKRELWYKRKFIAVFGGARIHRIDGYLVFEAERRTHRYAHL